ncbi:MAG TPA: histidine--tRNA ligase [Saprospiraceae bacterium]|nr:histidine--tRNA ligase [Saprospiraceae bacterium]
MKPRIPQGTRDFTPQQIAKRNYIFEIIKEVYELYGFRPIETPTMELLSTLTGKYGEEGDKLLFKILNNGDFLKDVSPELLAEKKSAAIIPKIAKRGLRYDLTVPFARFVVMNQNALSFPFKRYQIQPVWRADRPQKGRYREFYQCDADVIGSKSLLYEAELIQIIDEVFKRLNIKVTIHINNRKILAGIAEATGIGAEHFVDMTVAIDKLDKIGAEKVMEEMVRRGIAAPKAEQVMGLLEIDSIEQLAAKMDDVGSESGLNGVEKLQTIWRFLEHSPLTNYLKFDIALARGLNYYTGTIFEVTANDVEMGSILGGGRYDDLTGIFGLKNMSGVGISFGAERIYDIMEAGSLFPEGIVHDVQALIVTFDDLALDYGFGILTALRKAGIAADIYPEPVKMKKQMKYANARAIPFVIVIGDNEMKTGELVLKNMETGVQQTLFLEDLLTVLSPSQT